MERHLDSELSRRSVQLIRNLQTREGAYPASPTFSAYKGYSWFRDGAFIADAMSVVGEVDSASRFFDWCSSVLADRADHVHWIVSQTREGRPPGPDQMLPARFAFSGENGADEWWDFQLDGYGTWLWAVAEHCRRHALDGRRWASAISTTVEYLTESWGRPCYDWWEEHSDHIHVSTLACISAGLEAAVSQGLVDPAITEAALSASSAIKGTVFERGLVDGRLVKWLGSTAVDGSLAATIAPLGFVSACSTVGSRTLDSLERQLTVDGGTHRYLGDTFYGGGQWPLLSCFVGLAHAAAGDTQRARELYLWAASTANANLELPEQVGEHLIAPRMRSEWLERWGPVATPLLWSHAMLLRLGAELDRLADQPAETASIPEGTSR